MAKFVGTFDEFYQWANRRTQVWITQETKKARQAQRACPQCGQEARLTAAHVTPRKDVVREALGVKVDGRKLKLDLDDSWERIKDAHRPFEEMFRFLCKECHVKEDAPN